jgi:hypothetical protein
LNSIQILLFSSPWSNSQRRKSSNHQIIKQSNDWFDQYLVSSGIIDKERDMWAKMILIEWFRWMIKWLND